MNKLLKLGAGTAGLLLVACVLLGFGPVWNTIDGSVSMLRETFLGSKSDQELIREAAREIESMNLDRFQAILSSQRAHLRKERAARDEMKKKLESGKADLETVQGLLDSGAEVYLDESGTQHTRSELKAVEKRTRTELEDIQRALSAKELFFRELQVRLDKLENSLAALEVAKAKKKGDLWVQELRLSQGRALQALASLQEEFEVYPEPRDSVLAELTRRVSSVEGQGGGALYSAGTAAEWKLPDPGAGTH